MTTNCKFLKISYKDWISALGKKSKGELLDESIKTYEILPILKKNSDVEFPKELKKIRSIVKNIVQISEIKNLTIQNQTPKFNLDKKKDWFLDSIMNLLFMVQPFHMICLKTI